MAAWGEMTTTSFDHNDSDENGDENVDVGADETPIGTRVEPDIISPSLATNHDSDEDVDFDVDVVEEILNDDTPVQSGWIAHCETCDDWWYVETESDRACGDCEEIARAFRETLVHDENSNLPVSPEDLARDEEESAVECDENGVPIIRDMSEFLREGESA